MMGSMGLLSVAENNGQAIRAAFKLRERLYFVKEHSLYATQDDGVNEPALWWISEISRRVGTPSVRGVGVGEDWVVIAHRTGLYIFSGGEPVKISQEIQPTWNQINWQYGHTLWVTVDTKERRIFVGVPLGDRDFAESSADAGLSRPGYRGRYCGARRRSRFRMRGGKRRRTKRANGRRGPLLRILARLLERSDGTAIVAMGGGIPGVGGGGATGKVYQLNAAQLSDDGTAIPSYYTTHYFPERPVEQSLNLGAHRKLFSYLTMFVEGAGNLSLTSVYEFAQRAAGAAALAAELVRRRRIWSCRSMCLGERVAFQVGTNQSGAWFRLQKFIPSVRVDPWAPVRGFN